MITPLNQLITTNQHIKHKQFNSPPLNTNLPNKLNLLTKTFNQISNKLHKLYHSLKTSIKKKTHNLHKTKHHLKILYQYSQTLNTNQINIHYFHHILQIIHNNKTTKYLKLNINKN